MSKTYLVPVPVLEHLVLGRSPQIVAMPFVSLHEIDLAFESDLHDALVVREDTLMTVSEVETPDLDILVRRDGGDEFGVGRDVECQHGELKNTITTRFVNDL